MAAYRDANANQILNLIYHGAFFDAPFSYAYIKLLPFIIAAVNLSDTEKHKNTP